MTQKYQIDVPRLRKELCGSDKLPLDLFIPLQSVILYDRRTKLPIAKMMVRVEMAQQSNRITTRKHRIFVLVPGEDNDLVVGSYIPVGRLMQSNAWKVYRDTILPTQLPIDPIDPRKVW